MTFDPQEVLRRFHRALLREIRAANPEYLHSPFSVVIGNEYMRSSY